MSLEKLTAAIILKQGSQLFFVNVFNEKDVLKDKIDATIERETAKIEQAIYKASKADEIAEAKFVIGMVKAFRLCTSSLYHERLNFWDYAYVNALDVVKDG